MPTIDLIMNTPMDVDHDGIGYRGATLSSLQARGVPGAALLEAARSHLKARIDADAEAQRARVLTPGTGQALEYQEVQAQAHAALAAPAQATAELYPMLAATVGIDVDPETGHAATDVLGVARKVETAYAAWQVAGAAIRAARLRAKTAIDAAADIAAATAVYDETTWPTLAV